MQVTNLEGRCERYGSLGAQSWRSKVGHVSASVLRTLTMMVHDEFPRVAEAFKQVGGWNYTQAFAVRNVRVLLCLVGS